MLHNEQADFPKNLQPAPETVTTGPIIGSRKVYAAPKSHPEMRVPFREVPLTTRWSLRYASMIPPDPYTETDARIDLKSGLPQTRDAWIAGRGFEGITPRPVENGGQREHLDRQACAGMPGSRIIRAGKPGQLVDAI